MGRVESTQARAGGPRRGRVSGRPPPYAAPLGRRDASRRVVASWRPRRDWTKSDPGGCQARSGQARSASDGPQAGPAKPDSPRGTTCSGPANAGRFLVRVSRESVVRPTLSLYPPVAWDNGPRLWLLWVEARPSSCFWCAKSVGRWATRVDPFVRSVRSQGVISPGPSLRTRLSGP